jgi:hypothetical protein
LGFDIGLKGGPVHRAIDDPGRGQSILAQGSDEGLHCCDFMLIPEGVLDAILWN